MFQAWTYLSFFRGFRWRTSVSSFSQDTRFNQRQQDSRRREAGGFR